MLVLILEKGGARKRGGFARMIGNSIGKHTDKAGAYAGISNGGLQNSNYSCTPRFRVPPVFARFNRAVVIPISSHTQRRLPASNYSCMPGLGTCTL